MPFEFLGWSAAVRSSAYVAATQSPTKTDTCASNGNNRAKGSQSGSGSHNFPIYIV
jgi:hypothetical protein